MAARDDQSVGRADARDQRSALTVAPACPRQKAPRTSKAEGRATLAKKRLDTRQMSHLRCDRCRRAKVNQMVAKPKALTERLTRREREIMNVVFALGNRASAEDIRARLPSPPGDSAVRVMLTRLEKKGCLRHQQDGLRYVYSATTSPAAAQRRALRQYLETFFGGSLRQMMTALVSEAAWTDDELDALQREIDRVRKEGKKQP